MKNIFIISYSFPPLNNIAARRFGQMVQYMEQFGWQPYILSTENMGSLSVDIPESQCIRIGLHPQGTNRVTEMDQAINRLPSTMESIRNIAGKVNFRLRAMDRTVLTWGQPVKNNVNTIINQLPKIDLVLASYGPAASLWLGQWFASKYKAPWIADFRDLGALRRDKRAWLAYSIDRIMERRLLKNCSGITTVSKHLAGLLSETYGLPSKVIYNGWDKRQLRQTKDFGHRQNYIYYAGRLYSHQMMAVYNILQALTMVEETIHFKIRSLGPVELERGIMEYARRLGIHKRVEVLPPVEPDIVATEANNALTNVVVEDMDTTNIWAAGTLTGKFLQLLPGTVPIMAVARPDNEMGDILAATGRGRLCSSVDEVRDFLFDIVNNDKFALSKINADIVNQFEKERQAEELCKFCDVVINHG